MENNTINIDEVIADIRSGMDGYSFADLEIVITGIDRTRDLIINRNINPKLALDVLMLELDKEARNR